MNSWPVSQVKMLPTSLEAATARMMAAESVAREAGVFGHAFVDHFGGTREHEVKLWNEAVTDWEGAPPLLPKPAVAASDALGAQHQCRGTSSSRDTPYCVLDPYRDRRRTCALVDEGRREGGGGVILGLSVTARGMGICERRKYEQVGRRIDIDDDFDALRGNMCDQEGGGLAPGAPFGSLTQRDSVLCLRFLTVKKNCFWTRFSRF
jgi:hypothetical protein